jgi:AcrR family transcriptional regulator
MANTERKQLAKAQRELELIDIARDIIEKDGLNALTMDKVTALCEYSKGTVYNHFSCKEDLLVSVSNEGLKDLLHLFKKLDGFEGNGREQMIGLQIAYLYFSKLYPSQFMCVLTVKNPAILSRTSDTRKKQQIELEIALEERALEIVNRAIEQKELSLNPDREIKQITFANWSQTFGALVLVNAAESLVGLQGIDVGKEFFINAFVLNDGFNWQPLSVDYNYFDTIERLKKTVFFEEEILISEQNIPSPKIAAF